MFDDPDVDNCQDLVQRDVHLHTGSSVAAVRGTMAHLQFMIITMSTVNDVNAKFHCIVPGESSYRGVFIVESAVDIRHC